jgi:hypothetical protein
MRVAGLVGIIVLYEALQQAWKVSGIPVEENSE